jgi:hypothetical protein
MSKPHHGRTIILLYTMEKGLLETDLLFVFVFAIIGEKLSVSRKLKPER